MVFRYVAAIGYHAISLKLKAAPLTFFSFRFLNPPFR